MTWRGVGCGRGQSWTPQGALRRGDPGKRMLDNADTFLDSDDAVNRRICELVDLSAGPCNRQRFDLGAFAETEVDARIAGGHVASAALALLHLYESFGR